MKLVSMHPAVLRWRAQIEFHHRALISAQQRNDTRAAAHAHYQLAALYFQHADWDEAWGHIEEAAKGAHESDDVIGVCAVLLLRGNLELSRGNLPIALQIFLQTQTLATRIAAPIFSAGAALAAAGAYSQVGDGVQAIAAYQSALDGYAVLGDRMGLVHTYLNRGSHFFNFGDPAAAGQDYTAAEGHAAALQAPELQAQIWLAQGNWHLRFGHPAAAESLFHQALDLCIRSQNPSGQGQAHFHLANAFALWGRFAEAAQQYESAIRVFQAGENWIGEQQARSAWQSNPWVAGPPAEGADYQELLAELRAGGPIGPAVQRDRIGEPRASAEETAPTLERLIQQAPDTQEVLDALRSRGLLQARSEETGATLADTLLRILTAPRAQGLVAGDVYRYVLEKLDNPASITQRCAIPFAHGGSDTKTCTSASRLYVIASRKPSEFARWVEEITSPRLAFTITRAYPDRRHYQARVRFLEGYFPLRELGSNRLAIEVHPDGNALPRALAEHAARRYADYLSKRQEGNTRDAVDVLLQSAVTNLALRGQYDSLRDAGAVDGIRGVPFGTYGYLAMQQDIENRIGSDEGVPPPPLDAQGLPPYYRSPLDALDAAEFVDE